MSGDRALWFLIIGLCAVLNRLMELPLFWVAETWINVDWMLSHNGFYLGWWHIGIKLDGYHIFKNAQLLLVLLGALNNAADPQRWKHFWMLLLVWWALQVLGQWLLTV